MTFDCIEKNKERKKKETKKVQGQFSSINNNADLSLIFILTMF